MNWHIHISGQVQGVGFRPFVYRMAIEWGLKGWVNNTSDGVHIEITASKYTALTFGIDLKRLAPAMVRVTYIDVYELPGEPYADFRIIHSAGSDTAKLLVTPDFAMCPDCRNELTDENDRRYRYPFITCTNCGPRFSIIRSLPYDRENTEMERFTMCPKCQQEYENPMDRRYYSQTNSCPDCAVRLSLFNRSGSLVSEDQGAIIRMTAEAWKAGKIVAVKGIGGYLLTCRASDASAISTLRQRKHRPFKPFALMFPDLDALEAAAHVRPPEQQAIESPAAPIILLDAKPGAWASMHMEGIAPGLGQIGCMLPYTPLYALLMQEMKEPIVATSGNLTNAPIVYRDDQALGELKDIADLILLNNRDITVPQDDSVIRYSHIAEHRIIIRRSRGLAPTFLYPQLRDNKTPVVSTGAMLKSTFCILHQGNVYLSQYLGDLEHYETQQNYRYVMQHFVNLLGIKPEVVLHDQHPDYPSSHIAVELAKKWSADRASYQHHVAHFAAIIGEHSKLDTDEPILGVIWDGTGLGTDGHIWGGEFFLYRDRQFDRHSHFEYFDFILGDKMPKEPRISAMAITRGIPSATGILEEKFTAAEWKLYRQVLQRGSKLKSSSVGRIFDGVASLLGIRDKQTHEGEAAMLLEALASKYLAANNLKNAYSYLPPAELWESAPLRSILEKLVADIRKGVPDGLIALNFHYTLVEVIWDMAKRSGARHLAFSGGVFQNALLIDLIILHPNPDGYELIFHKNLSPNDECISFGQLMCYLIDR